MTEAERLALCLKYPYPSADTRKEAATLLRQLQAENEALRVSNEKLEADAKRLDWIDSKNAPFSMGWNIAQAPAGNISISSCIFLAKPPVTIRDAIDAAIKGEPTC